MMYFKLMAEKLFYFKDNGFFLSSSIDTRNLNVLIIFSNFLLFSRVLSFSLSSLGTSESSPSPRYTWSEHALPVTDIHCGHGGMRGHVITASLDQTCKVLV